ncbi:conserved hypothetical protein [Pediculus humanus corporis]|uniref:BZIP domain-containing protein n=1 Tax=Pediculus humanus subsp. corporis TaxID=121224 RepID=E0VJ69_PEDHC|nr:uncharacterized protein Phum_PHUM239100 [Pediculus humanus corporis]EEB13425.1 conserved hypothetical protein [Pediculus humanus corporis]
MGDPLYSGEFYIDSGLLIKPEPGIDQMCTSASVPIPHRRMTTDSSEFRDFNFDINSDVLSSSVINDSNCEKTSGLIVNENNLWDKTETRNENYIKMDEEDIFQVDKADLIQGPTLAELNANDDTLLGDLSFDDLLLPEESNCFANVPFVAMGQQDINAPAVNVTDGQITSQSHLSVNSPFAPSSFPPAGLGFLKDGFNSSSSVPSSPLELYLHGATSALSPSSHSQHSSSSSILQPPPESTPPNSISPLQIKHSTLHELLLKESFSSPDRLQSLMGRSPKRPSSPSVCAPTSPKIYNTRSTRHNISRLSSSAPTHLGLEQIWQRREPRKHLLSTGSLAEGGSTSSISMGVLSPESRDFSQDEGSESEDESDHYEYDNVSSDAESSDGEGVGKEKLSKQQLSKKERYFWQYNVQAKGPKGQRLVLKTKLEDPHVLNEVTDPVFSPSCSVRGIKHSGKARKGDGNDLTPNPRKLHLIGKELDKLGKVINDMAPVSELPFNVRPKTRKEKNKLASRACRLKKKAQHEANKIKLYGLEHEHKKLLTGIQQMKQLLVAKVNTTESNGRDEINKHADKVVKNATKVRIAGYTTEYVNRVLDKVRSGITDGGLDEFN